MLAFLDGIYFTMQQKTESLISRLKEDESGVSAFVATILLILIVVLLCALFWDRIQEWFNQTWSSITDGAGKISSGG